MTSQGKTVLITGAAKRLGRAIAIHLAKAGWSVGDASYLRDGKVVLLVTCVRGKERTTAEGDS